MALIPGANGARGQVAEDNAHEAKPANDDQHRKILGDYLCRYPIEIPALPGHCQCFRDLR